MKTLLDKITRDEILSRINVLQEGSTAQWGKMTAYQMLKHCALAEEMFLGIKVYPRSFIGRLFGKMALKGFLKDETPIKKNMHTLSHVKMHGNETGNFSVEKQKLVALINAYSDYPNPGFVHPFFGYLTKEQAGYFAYKHIDHHLRQFNS